MRAEDLTDDFYDRLYVVLHDAEAPRETLTGTQLCDEVRAGHIQPRTLIESVEDGRVYRAMDYAMLGPVFLQVRATSGLPQKQRRNWRRLERTDEWYTRERDDAIALPYFDAKPVVVVIVLLVMFSILILMFSPVDLSKSVAPIGTSKPTDPGASELLNSLHDHS